MYLSIYTGSVNQPMFILGHLTNPPPPQKSQVRDPNDLSNQGWVGVYDLGDSGSVSIKG